MLDESIKRVFTDMNIMNPGEVWALSGGDKPEKNMMILKISLIIE
ncbi:hypothetical protein ACFL0H_10190 [Thermodesulfobacteriota bacterium]